MTNTSKKKSFVEKYPKITIESSLLTKLEDGSYKGIFKLTIKDKTKVVNIPFTFIEINYNGKFIGIFTINRLDYGVGTSGFIMSDYVTILIELNTILK